MNEDERKKCLIAMALLNIAAWVLFIMMDAVAELLLNADGIFDYGWFTIPCILTVLYMVFEKKLFGVVRFKAKYNLLMTGSFILMVVILGAIAWFLCLTLDIWLIPQPSRGWFDLNGIEYLIFPFTYGIVSLILGFVLKLISYILYRRKNR